MKQALLPEDWFVSKISKMLSFRCKFGQFLPFGFYGKVFKFPGPEGLHSVHRRGPGTSETDTAPGTHIHSHIRSASKLAQMQPGTISNDILPLYNPGLTAIDHLPYHGNAAILPCMPQSFFAFTLERRLEGLCLRLLHLMAAMCGWFP